MTMLSKEHADVFTVFPITFFAEFFRRSLDVSVTTILASDLKSLSKFPAFLLTHPVGFGNSPEIEFTMIC